MHIKIKRGLDIPIAGAPSGEIQSLPKPQQVALDLSPFPEIRFRVLVNPGDEVLLGQPLALDKRCEERKFVSPAAGRVIEVRRGLKRRLLSILIDVADKEEAYPCTGDLCEGGLFAHIRQRPFGVLADPRKKPNRIFVRAIETAPFVPPAEMQVQGYEDSFKRGLDELKKYSEQIHVVSRPETFEDTHTDTIEGPHPAGTSSVHIHKIAPITGIGDTVWTLNAHDVVTIGEYLEGRHHVERIISIAGKTPKAGFYRARAGYPIAPLATEGRLISGDPLHGTKVETQDFLGFDHFALTILDDQPKRPFLSFLRLKNYTAHRVYRSGPGPFSFNTSLHGEERAFIDAAAYNKVMPMRIPTVQLIKALIAEDWDLAERLGIYEVDAEDFALSTFVCPSKVEMVEIAREALQKFAAEG